MEQRLKSLMVAVALCSLAACATEEPLDTGGIQNGGNGGAAGAAVNNAAGQGGVGGVAGTSVAGTGGSGGASGDAAAGVGGAGGMIANNIGGTGGGGGTGGTTAGTGGTPGNECEASDAYEPLVARPGETCYEFTMHDGDGSSPFIIPPNESYNQFYFDVPWGADEVATRFGQVLDNEGVLHHWLGFTTDVGTPGTVSRNVLGTTIGENATLFAGWAVGGCNVEFPSNMGLLLDDPGSKKVMIQWHHYNFTGQPQPDATKIQVCTVPSSMRADIGSLTWLGTEDLGGNGLLGGGMPPGVESKFSGTCLNETSAPITIVAFLPHMHEIGTHMFTEVLRAGGEVETVFDRPFQFDYQVHYNNDPWVVLQPGDKIRAECTYFNGTQGNVAFGQSTKQEMCYQFAFAYPAGALEKPDNFSLIGATNTCWGD